jgi:sulfite exporter TauE/SafE
MVITALIMGFAGSLHCVGMCSPLAIAVSNLSPGALMNRFIYNLGRIIMYGLLGAIVGVLGWTLPFNNFQNLFSIVLGVTLLLFSVWQISNVRVPLLTPLLQRLTITLKKVFGIFLQRKSFASVFMLGFLNGILPCGLTFLALTYCLTLANPVTSLYYMLLFGVGTLPAMLGMTAGFQYIVKRFNISFKKVTTAMLLISGCLLIARVFLFHEGHLMPEDHSMMEIILCR